MAKRIDVLRCIIENDEIYEAEIAEKLYGNRSATANLTSALKRLQTKYGFPYIERLRDPHGSIGPRTFVRLIRTYSVVQAIWADSEYKELQEVIFQQRWAHELLLQEITGVPDDVKNYIKERCEQSRFLFSLLMDTVTQQGTILELTGMYNKFPPSQQCLDRLAEIQARHTLLKPILEAIYYWRLLDGDYGAESENMELDNMDNVNFGNLKSLTVLLIELDDIYDSIGIEPDDLSLRIYLDRSNSLIEVLKNHMVVHTPTAHGVKDELKSECAYSDMLEDIHRWYFSYYTLRYTPRHRPSPPLTKPQIVSEFK